MLSPRCTIHFSIRCSRNSSVPHPSLTRICTGVWPASSEYHTHTLPLDCSGPEWPRLLPVPSKMFRLAL